MKVPEVGSQSRKKYLQVFLKDGDHVIDHPNRGVSEESGAVFIIRPRPLPVSTRTCGHPGLSHLISRSLGRPFPRNRKGGAPSEGAAVGSILPPSRLPRATAHCNPSCAGQPGLLLSSSQPDQVPIPGSPTAPSGQFPALPGDLHVGHVPRGPECPGRVWREGDGREQPVCHVRPGLEGWSGGGWSGVDLWPWLL